MYIDKLELKWTSSLNSETSLDQATSHSAIVNSLYLTLEFEKRTFLILTLPVILGVIKLLIFGSILKFFYETKFSIEMTEDG